MVSRLSILALILCASTLLRAQSPDDELAILPPMPNLYLGDPERELSGKMKRALAREEERKRRAAAAEQEAMKAEVRSFRTMSEPQAEKGLFKKPVVKKRSGPVTNSISSLENATTADGTRLQPFGEPDYWGGIPEVQEDTLIELPPMPDLRTPDQVTRMERRRNKYATKAKVRNLTNEAAREKREQDRAVVVTRPESDPSLALVQVRSNQGAPSAGIQDTPTTIDNSSLKPFNENSTYYRDGFLMFRGDSKREPGGFRLFRKKSE